MAAESGPLELPGDDGLTDTERRILERLGDQRAKGAEYGLGLVGDELEVLADALTALGRFRRRAMEQLVREARAELDRRREGDEAASVIAELRRLPPRQGRPGCAP